ncbi:MAG: DnaB-like helicase C-terminal domain-containing protein [Rubrivivax sp.]
MDRVNELHDNGAEDVTGVRTGYFDLDRLTAGLPEGRPDRLAARPSMETAFALNITQSMWPCVKSCAEVLVFSMEMRAARLALRMVGSIGRINQQNLRTGRLAEDEWGGWPRRWTSSRRRRSSSTRRRRFVAELRARARRMARQFERHAQPPSSSTTCN